MIDAGCFLTKAVEAGENSTVIKVEDARYFMDGWGITDGDTIQLQGHKQTAKVKKVDYKSNTITIDKPLSWPKGAGVGLAYNGSSPDMGAYEYQPDSEVGSEKSN